MEHAHSPPPPRARLPRATRVARERKPSSRRSFPERPEVITKSTRVARHCCHPEGTLRLLPYQAAALGAWIQTQHPSKPTQALPTFRFHFRFCPDPAPYLPTPLPQGIPSCSSLTAPCYPVFLSSSDKTSHPDKRKGTLCQVDKTD